MTDTQPTRVVHCRKDDFDVYIGRPMKRFPELVASGWGNPFRAGYNAVSRGDAVQRYRYWIQHQPKLLKRLPELQGKRLGCWCAPAGGMDGNLEGTTCHGEILAALADAPSALVTVASAMTPRDLAKWLIRPYVLRGDSVEDLQRGGMGYAGRMGDVNIHREYIQVRRMGPYRPSNKSISMVIAEYKLGELYREIQVEEHIGVTQASLFDMEGEEATS